MNNRTIVDRNTSPVMSENNTASSGTAAIYGGLVALEMSLAGLIALFGISGNLLTICVLRVPNLRKTSTAFYFTVLAAVDILVLLIGPTTKALAAAVYASDRQFRDTHEVACKMLMFLNYSVTQISAWILVAVTIDRMVWVVCPFKAREFCTIRRATIVVVLIVCLICLINCGHPFYITLVSKKNHTQCSATNHFIKHTYVNYIDPALVTIGPFLVMFIANLLIIRKLHQVKAKRERNLHKAPNKKKDGSNLTKMLLCTSIFYLVSSLPYLVLMTVLKEKRSEILRLKPLVLNIIYLVQVCSYSLFNLNYAIQFLLYCLTGPAFKAEAFRLLRIRQRRPRDGGGKGGAGKECGGDGGGRRGLVEEDDEGGGVNGGVTGMTGGERRTVHPDMKEREEAQIQHHTERQQKPELPAKDMDMEEAVELLEEAPK